MDIILVMFIVILVFMTIVSFCRWCCRKITGSPTSTITTTVVTVPNNSVQRVTAPYPVNASAMPQPMAYGGQPSVPVGVAPSAYQTQAPYPNVPNMRMPYPGQSFNTPYPPGPASYPHPPGGNVQQNPPSYAEATGIYERQSAFNPNFK